MVNKFYCTVCYTVGRVSVPLWLADLAWPMSILDRLLAGVVVDRVLWRYLLRPAAGDSMERFFVDAGHVLWGGQDCGRQEENCEDRESEARGHGDPLYCSQGGIMALAEDYFFVSSGGINVVSTSFLTYGCLLRLFS